MKNKNIIVIKMGGIASDNLTSAFYNKIQYWMDEGKQIVIVHGGGHYISEMMEKMHIPVHIKNGLRVTTSEVLSITQMVLIGQVQPLITTNFQQNGFSAVGLNASCNQLIIGNFLDQTNLGYVGEVKTVKSQLLTDLVENDYIPIVAPLGITESGEWLNINADSVACKIAEELKAEALYLLTDVPGVKKDNQWLKELHPSEIEQLKKEKVVKGGMLPKLDSAAAAIASGVQAVHITDALDKTGTIIKLKKVTV